MNNEFLLFKSSLVEIRITSLFCMHCKGPVFLKIIRTVLLKNPKDNAGAEDNQRGYWGLTRSYLPRNEVLSRNRDAALWYEGGAGLEGIIYNDVSDKQDICVEMESFVFKLLERL